MPRELIHPRKVCFVTGTRAEFGLMKPVLRAIQADAVLQLQLIVTGMHLDKSLGHSITQIRAEGWTIDATVPWKTANVSLAAQTGNAITGIARALDKLQSEIVLVVGDRVEAFAAATAAHLSGRIVAHIHGGDRAQGQVDDTLRHTITKLAHIHFPATAQSAQRIKNLGEDTWRIHLTGSPGIDGITTEAAREKESHAGKFALIILHPTDANESAEHTRAKMLHSVCQKIGFAKTVVIHPNNDPGSAGIVRAWDSITPGASIEIHRNLPREKFLSLLRDSAVLLGNSSSGIIEAASFGTPVLDIGNRQLGRQRGPNVSHVNWNASKIHRALQSIWNDGHPIRFPKHNLYGSGKTGAKMARLIRNITINDRLQRKLIVDSIQ